MTRDWDGYRLTRIRDLGRLAAATRRAMASAYHRGCRRLVPAGGRATARPSRHPTLRTDILLDNCS
jgi:hypothetical protein